MSKRQIIMILGVIIILLPFLGFSSNWDTVFSVIMGFIIIAIAYSSVPDISSKTEKIVEKETKKENNPDLPFVEHHVESDTNFK